MADQTDVQHLVKQLMAGASPEENQALLDALMSGQVTSILDRLKRDEQPEIRPVPEQTRGFRIRLDLHGAKPPVWRRLELPGDLTLPRVQDAIQAAMGWYSSHLHRFRMSSDHRSAYFATEFDLDEGDEGDEGMPEYDVRLDQVLAAKGDELWYEYDFGSGWDHRLVVEAVLDAPPISLRCTAGRMACPPEDCGGIRGYEEIAAWVRSGYDDSHLPQSFENAEHGRDWLPVDWHPDHFDLDEINEALAIVSAEPVAVVDGLAELLDQMDRRGIRALRDVLGSPMSHGPAELSDAEAERLTQTYRTFLDIVGDGVALTAAGYLPPTIVEDIAARTGISAWWIGKANREDQTFPVGDIRSTARALGLVSVRKGHLAPTAAALRCTNDPQALLGHILGRLPIGTKDFERDAGWMVLAVAGSGTPAEQWRDETADLLHALGWSNGRDRFTPPPPNSPTLQVLEHLAGRSSSRWGEVKGTDLGVAAAARGRIRR